MKPGEAIPSAPNPRKPKIEWTAAGGWALIRGMKRLLFILVLLSVVALSNFGGDTNAAGVWKWSLVGQTGDTLLKLKQDGEKLTGSYTNQFGAAEITDGSFKDGDITFKVKRDFNGQAFVIKYSGKLSGDKITGKCEFDVNGQTRALKWEATRDAAPLAPSPATEKPRSSLVRPSDLKPC